jgi:hypothetical protein
VAVGAPLSLEQWRLKGGGGSGWWAAGGVAAGLARRNSNLFYLCKLISIRIDLIQSKE